eukprot:gb/GFBE01046095.1/.p1 GENE.gb/GFBE01046095.1/~~gb/GFBE01046095.1/.p1  ORF type:complete len:506 (+),score=111.03 gb/GFBE01046095.1/:1-1518(+)
MLPSLSPGGQAGGAPGAVHPPPPAGNASFLPPIEVEGSSRPGTTGGARADATLKLQAGLHETTGKPRSIHGHRVSFSHTAEETEAASLSRTLSAFKIFKDLDPAVLSTLPEVVTSIFCKAGTVLFRQGDPPGSCYVIISGMVGIYAMSEEEIANESQSQKAHRLAATSDGSLLDFLPGHKTVDGFSRYHEDSSLGNRVAKLGPSNIAGELALMNDQPRSASVQCMQDCEFLVIRRVDFDNVLKEEMVKKGDEKLRFLMEHLPGMAEVAVPKPGGKPHASYVFRRAKCQRGHTFLVQGTTAEPHIWAVFKGSVEFRRAETLRGANGEMSMPSLLPGKSLSPLRKKGLKKTSSAPRLHGIGRDGNVAAEANDADPNGVMSRRGVLVAGGVFGSLPIPAPEPFTVRVTSPICEVFYISAADYSKIPRKLLDTLQEYVASSTVWRLGCHQRSQDLRRTNFRTKKTDEDRDVACGAGPSSGKSMQQIFEDCRQARKDNFEEFRKEAFVGT